MRQVNVTTPQELECLVSAIMFEENYWMTDFNLAKRLLEAFPMELGPHGHGWYSAAPGFGEPSTRAWYVKAATPEWAICAGALAASGVQVVYTGTPPSVTPDLP